MNDDEPQLTREQLAHVARVFQSILNERYRDQGITWIVRALSDEEEVAHDKHEQ